MLQGTLYLRCIEARYLPTKSSSNGYCDSYVKFKMNTAQFKSGTVLKCNSPVWGEDFVIPVNGTTLSVSVWDAHRYSPDDMMGSCDIDLLPLLAKPEITSWFGLCDSKGISLPGAAILLCMILMPEGPTGVYTSLLDQALVQYAMAEEKKDQPELSLQMVTWNVGNHAPPDDLSQLVPKTRAFDIVAVGLQESRYQEGSDALWQGALTTHLGLEYVMVASQCLWEIGLYVFAHRKHSAAIHSVEKKVESTGIAHVMGNKGGVVISFYHNDLSLCFVSSHLAAQMSKMHRRNRDVAEIIKGTKMGFKAHTDILNQFHHVFWMGDLNYRLHIGDPEADTPSAEVFSEVTTLIEAKQFEKLFALDQLTKERESGNVFVGFQEGSMTHFPPTFKVERKEGYTYTPQRCPAWTDRILWKSLKNVPSARQLSLSAQNVATSDHKPVMGIFELTPFFAPPGLDSTVGQCAIVLTSLEGKGLRASDANGLSDPFIYFFSSFTDSAKTTTVFKNLNPVWNPRDLPTLISFVNSRPKLRKSFIKVVAFDQDVASADDEIGNGVLYLENLSQAKPNTDVPFSIPLTLEGLPAGSLNGTFQLQFTKLGEQRSRRRSLLARSPRSTPAHRV